MPTTNKSNTQNNTTNSQNTNPQFNVGNVLGSIFGGGSKSSSAGSGGTRSSSSSSSSSGGGGGVWGAVASVVNNVANNLFGAKYKNRELDLQAQEQKFKQSLNTLDNQQKYVLQQALNNAKTQSERLQILESAITQIKVAQINNAGANQMKTAYLVLGSAVVLVGLLFVIKKID